jgi:hypothetical protein
MNGETCERVGLQLSEIIAAEKSPLSLFLSKRQRLRAKNERKFKLSVKGRQIEKISYIKKRATSKKREAHFNGSGDEKFFSLFLLCLLVVR